MMLMHACTQIEPLFHVPRQIWYYDKSNAPRLPYSSFLWFPNSTQLSTLHKFKVGMAVLHVTKFLESPFDPHVQKFEGPFDPQVPSSNITSQALDWNPQGRRRARRPRQTWRRSTEAEIRESGMTWTQLKRTAPNRVRWRSFVAAQCSSMGQED